MCLLKFLSRLDWDERNLTFFVNFQKREIPWEKVPFVPRPSLVPDPITAFGKRKPKYEPEKKRLITDPLERAKIKPKVLLNPPEPYVSARDRTREKVFSQMYRHEMQSRDVLHNPDSIDVVLPRLHKLAEQPNLPYKRRLLQGTSDFYVF